MAISQTSSWTVRATVRFGSVEFLTATDGTLVLIGPPAPTLSVACVITEAPSVTKQMLGRVAAHEGMQLWRHLLTFLGPASTQENLYHALFTLANIQGQLVGEQPLSPELLKSKGRPAHPHGLHNAAGIMQRLQIPRTSPVPPNIEFVGMVGEMSKSFFDLLDQGTEVGSHKESSNEHHLSCECHMVQINPVVVRDAAALEVPPTGAPPPDPTQLHWLQERRRELDDAHRQLAQEQEAMDRELEQQMGRGRARARPCNVKDQIINAKPGKNQFAQAGQNIAMVAALLEMLPDPVMPEAQRVQRWMAELLAKAVQQ